MTSLGVESAVELFGRFLETMQHQTVVVPINNAYAAWVAGNTARRENPREELSRAALMSGQPGGGNLPGFNVVETRHHQASVDVETSISTRLGREVDILALYIPY